MKRLGIILIISVFLASCQYNDGFYSFYRVSFKNIYVTKKGIDLKTEAIPDQINIINGQPVISAYYMEVTGEFTHVYDTIVQYGHVWSQSNPVPTINPADTNHYTRLGAWPADSSGTFLSQISGLYPNTPVYVRSYIITSHNDTGYNPVILVDTTTDIVDAWYRSADLANFGRTGAVVLTYNTNGDNPVVIVGTGQAGEFLLDDMWQFDPEAETWTQFSNYPLKISQSAGFIVQYKNNINQTLLKAYMGTGELNIEGTVKCNYWYEYNFGTNNWQTTRSSTTYPFKISKAVAFAIGKYGYIGFGETQDNISLTVFYRFDPLAADTVGVDPWLSIPTLDAEYARSDAVAFVIQNIGFVGTGINTNTGKVYNDLWKFYPDEANGGFWVRCQDMPTAGRYAGVGFAIADYGFVGLGTDGSSGFRDFYRYDPFLDKWHPCTDYKIGPDYNGEVQTVKDAVGFGLKNAGYVGTGYALYDTTDHFTNDFWKYIPW